MVSDIGKGIKCASEEAARDREECDGEIEGDVHLCCGLVARGRKESKVFEEPMYQMNLTNVHVRT